jgi:glutathione peroxidase
MSNAKATIYGFSAPLLSGRTVKLEEFRGSVLLIVNTASRCGFTPQYAGLEELYRSHRERGLTVLGFPCNQFGKQEPGSDGEITAFCERNYGVSFPMFDKVDVNGPNAHPLYRFLRKEQPGKLGFLGLDRIPWNFTKFLVGRAGCVVARFGSSKAPVVLTGIIEELLSRES